MVLINDHDPKPLKYQAGCRAYRTIRLEIYRTGAGNLEGGNNKKIN